MLKQYGGYSEKGNQGLICFVGGGTEPSKGGRQHTLISVHAQTAAWSQKGKKKINFLKTPKTAIFNIKHV